MNQYLLLAMLVTLAGTELPMQATDTVVENDSSTGLKMDSDAS